MKFACEQCQTKYTIPDERVRGKILKIRCKNCNCQISISEGGVRTTRVAEPVAEPTMAMMGDQMPGMPGLGEGGDSTMIGGMADFFPGKQPDTEDWHISVDGAMHGPLTLTALAQRIVAEQSTPGRDIFVWREGFAEWLPPADVEEVKQALQKAQLTPAPKAAQPAPAVSKPAPKPTPVKEVAPPPDESGDATQIGSLNLPGGLAAAMSGSPPEDEELDELEAVDSFEMESDVPAPPKLPPKPAPKPPMPAMPKAPPSFKPPTPAAKPQPPKVELAPPPPAATPAPPAAVAESADPMATGQLAAFSPAGSNGAGAANSLAGNPSPGYDAGSAAPMDGGYQSAAMNPMGSDQGAADVNLGKSGKSKTPLIAALAAVLLLGGGGAIYMLTRPATTPPTVAATTSDAGAADGGSEATAKAGTPAGTKTDDKTATKADDKSGKNESTGLSADELSTLLEKGDKALSSCYTKALKKSKKLKGGKLNVTVAVTAKGKADNIELSGPESDDKLGKCVEKAIKRWKFPKRSAYQAKFPLTITD